MNRLCMGLLAMTTALTMAVHAQEAATAIQNGLPQQPHEQASVSAEEVVQRQVDAYNARDIDAFLATYSPDAKLYRQPDKLLISGVDDMHKRYAKLFEAMPNLHVRIAKRIVIGNRVIDEEIVDGRKDGKPMHAAAIYEVVGDKITRVWFVDEQG